MAKEVVVGDQKSIPFESIYLLTLQKKILSVIMKKSRIQSFGKVGDIS